jgi:hypothetical protein
VVYTTLNEATRSEATPEKAKLTNERFQSSAEAQARTPEHRWFPSGYPYVFPSHDPCTIGTTSANKRQAPRNQPGTKHQNWPQAARQTSMVWQKSNGAQAASGFLPGWAIARTGPVATICFPISFFLSVLWCQNRKSWAHFVPSLQFKTAELTLLLCIYRV